MKFFMEQAIALRISKGIVVDRSAIDDIYHLIEVEYEVYT